MVKQYLYTLESNVVKAPSPLKEMSAGVYIQPGSLFTHEFINSLKYTWTGHPSVLFYEHVQQNGYHARFYLYRACVYTRKIT